MANNRMQLKCKICGETYTLAKYWISGWSECVNDYEDFDEFLNKHLFCVWKAPDEKLEKLNADAEHIFDLVLENDELLN